ncbi:MAG: N-acetyltransferase family protein [Dehalococcoidia bacterium]|nr:N-acetyltransferase family protein [Dehalococcoidia bacterium]
MPLEDVRIRDALHQDIPAITALYNAWIPTRTIAWTEALQTIEERTRWFERQRAQGFPILVADIGGEERGEVVGFTSYGHFRGEGKWPGYSTTVEHTIHIREDYWGRGVGRALIEGLVERARAAGFHVMIGAVDGENDDSVRFHAALGFVEVARMPQVGHKFGRWLDLILMQRTLDDRDRP